MLRRVLASSRYIVFIAVVAALLASVALILYEAIVIAEVIFNAATKGGFLPQPSKTLAVGLIEAIDVFLIAIVALIIGLGLHTLFIDDMLPLPRWLKINNLDDLKRHLVSIIIGLPVARDAVKSHSSLARNRCLSSIGLGSFGCFWPHL